MKSPLFRSLALLSAFAFVSLTARAQVITAVTQKVWTPSVSVTVDATNGPSTWDIGANWTGAAVPASSDTVIFNSTSSATAPTLTFNNGSIHTGLINNSITGIVFASNAIASYTLSASGGSATANITIGADGIQNYSTFAQIIQGSKVGVTLSGTSFFDVGSSGNLTLGPSGGSPNVAIGGNALTLKGSSGGQGFITTSIAGVGGSVTKSGTGMWTLSGANAFTGGLTVSGGTLTLGNAGALGAVAGNVTVSGGTLAVATSNTARTGTVSLTGGTINGAGTLTKTGGVFDVQSGTASTILAGSAGLTKSTSGTVTLDGAAANTYLGATTVSAGILILNKTAGVNAIAAGTTLTIDGTGTLQLGAINQLTGVNLTINGGTFALNNTLNTTSAGVLTVGASGGILDFGAGGNSTFHFANSAATTWTGTLSIVNYIYGTSHLFFGTDDTGLTNAQLAQLDFSPSVGAGNIGKWVWEVPGPAGRTADFVFNSGEVVPEPSTYAAIFGVAALGLAIYRRRSARATVA